jgi:hypothetical protein
MRESVVDYWLETLTQLDLLKQKGELDEGRHSLLSKLICEKLKDEVERIINDKD